MKEVSIYKPLKNGKDLALIDVLEVKQDTFPLCDTKAKVKIRQARRSIEIDQVVVNRLRQMFGNMPLSRAIRILIGLKPKVAQNAWQEEEDEFLRKYYPEHGSKHLAGVLDRKPHCIRDRASKLKIRRLWKYKRDRRNLKQ